MNANDDNTRNVESDCGLKPSIRTSSPYIAYVVMNDMKAMETLESSALFTIDFVMDVEDDRLEEEELSSSSSFNVSSRDRRLVDAVS